MSTSPDKNNSPEFAKLLEQLDDTTIQWFQKFTHILHETRNTLDYEKGCHQSLTPTSKEAFDQMKKQIKMETQILDREETLATAVINLMLPHAIATKNYSFILTLLKNDVRKPATDRPETSPMTEDQLKTSLINLIENKNSNDNQDISDQTGLLTEMIKRYAADGTGLWQKWVERLITLAEADIIVATLKHNPYTCTEKEEELFYQYYDIANAVQENLIKTCFETNPEAFLKTIKPENWWKHKETLIELAKTAKTKKYIPFDPTFNTDPDNQFTSPIDLDTPQAERLANALIKVCPDFEIENPLGGAPTTIKRYLTDTA
jgi:hypothetical protein